MLYCDDCRSKKNWPDSILESGKCEVCGKTQLCNDVPAVMLIPEADRTTEQKLVLQAVQQGFHEKADSIVITTLDGKIDNRLTEMVRKIFINRHGEIDWFATFKARLKVQEGHREFERAERDRRQR